MVKVRRYQVRGEGGWVAMGWMVGVVIGVAMRVGWMRGEGDGFATRVVILMEVQVASGGVGVAMGVGMVGVVLCSVG